MQFTPLHDFVHEESQSHYLVGLSYKVRPQDTKLAALVPQWIKQGKIKRGVPDVSLSGAKVAGSGRTA
ncbi:MAG: hypothetical protein IH604_15880 [Burkholderiales bacterium]|nr:hypothetical protein [Burkholderiales bacterium]